MNNKKFLLFLFVTITTLICAVCNMSISSFADEVDGVENVDETQEDQEYNFIDIDSPKTNVAVSSKKGIPANFTCHTDATEIIRYVNVYYGSDKLTFGDDYFIYIAKYCTTSLGNYKTATYELKVKGCGNYYGTYEVSISTMNKAEITGVKIKGKNITVNWHSTSGAYGYKIYRKQGSGKFKKIKTITNGSVNSYTDSNIKDPTTPYTYYVVPYSYNNSHKMFSFSASPKYKTTLLQSPKINVNRDSEGLKLTWKPAKFATGYYVYRRIGYTDKFKKIASIKGGKKRVFIDRKSVRDNEAFYKVVAVRNGKTASNETTPVGNIYVNNPTFVSCTKVSSTQINVNFKSNTTRTMGIVVQVSTNSSFKNAKNYHVTAGATSKTISNLKSGTTYYIRIRDEFTAAYKSDDDNTFSLGGSDYTSWSATKKITLN